MSKKKNPVIHFEMGYNNKQRMADFYSKVFGWEMKMLGPEMGNYVVAQTTETDESGMIKNPGNINGGFYQKDENPLSQAPSVVIAVEDIKAAIREVEAAGGKILGAIDKDGNSNTEPMNIPGVGLWISAMDTENNRFSIMQPNNI